MALLKRWLAVKDRARYYCALILLLPVWSSAQVICGPNMDFESGTFSGWTGKTGTCIVVGCDTFSGTPGLVLPNSLYPGYMGRHAITSGSGMDPMCGIIQEVCPWGGTHSLRLGNTDVNFETEDIQFTYTVSATNPIIIYSYAVMLEDPNHPDSVQPAFKTYIKDRNGAIVPCSYYKVNATNMRGHSSCVNWWQGTQIWYFPWRNIAIDMSAYAGQQVTLYFQTNDCGWGAHFGMAYVDIIGCYPKQIAVGPCPAINSVQLTAPVGFASYIWSNGMVGQTITVDPRVTPSIQCTITSFQGCRIILTARTSPGYGLVSYNNTTVCVCRGPTYFWDTSQLSTTPTGYLWNFGDGLTSNSQTPLHQYAAAGTYYATMSVTGTDGCTYVTSHPVVVNPCPTISPISHN